MTDERITDNKAQLLFLQEWSADLEKRDLYTQSALVTEPNEPRTELAFEAASHRRFLLASLTRIGIERFTLETVDRHLTLASHFAASVRLCDVATNLADHFAHNLNLTKGK
jgi:hypothetical protein